MIACRSAAGASLAVKAALHELLTRLFEDRVGCPLPGIAADEAATAGRPALARMALGRSLGPLQQCQALPEDT